MWLRGAALVWTVKRGDTGVTCKGVECSSELLRCRDAKKVYTKMERKVHLTSVSERLAGEAGNCAAPSTPPRAPPDGFRLPDSAEKRDAEQAMVTAKHNDAAIVVLTAVRVEHPGAVPLETSDLPCCVTSMICVQHSLGVEKSRLP